MALDMEKLLKILIQDEGERLSIYRDSLGFFTVGVGHLVTRQKDDMKMAITELDKQIGRSTGGHITKQESAELLEKDINIVINGIERSNKLRPLYHQLSDVKKLGLISMCFQMGIAGVEGFNNSMRFLLQENWDRASRNLRVSKWYKQTPNRAERVINMICYGDLRPYGYNYVE